MNGMKKQNGAQEKSSHARKLGHDGGEREGSVNKQNKGRKVTENGEIPQSAETEKASTDKEKQCAVTEATDGKVSDGSGENSSSKDNNNIPVDEKEKDPEKEEKERLEAEAKKKEEEMQQAQEILQEVRERVEAKVSLRNKNISLNSDSSRESLPRSLDSSVKKNSSFIKKLRTVTEQQRDSLTSEFQGLNLSRYIQEAVTSIIEGLSKLKMADVGCLVHMCSLFHQRYAEFTDLLIREVIKVFDNYGGKEEEKVGNISRFRVSLRLLAELVLCGVFVKMEEGAKVLINILSNIINSDKDTHTYLSVVVSFCRYCGEDVVGVLPRKQKSLVEKFNLQFPKCEIMSQDAQNSILELLLVYYKSLCKHLEKSHKDLQSREEHNRHILMTKGELNAERKEEYEKLQKSYEKLHTNTSALSDMLDQDMPDLPESQQLCIDDSGINIDVFNPFKHTEYDGETGLWEDEDTRTFYESLKDLRAFVPGILYKDSKKNDNNQKAEEKGPKSKEEMQMEDLTMLEDELMEELLDEDTTYEEESNEDEAEEDSDSSTPNYASMALQLESILLRLPNCVNRDLVDEVANDFVMTCNTKGNRKKLSRALFNVPRTRLDLLPFYSRLVATLDPCMPDLTEEIFKLLRGEFRYHVKKKDQINVESKVKTVRFIGELTKFNMFPKNETLHCLKMLLDQFSHHHIEMACNLLESCGRFLFRSVNSHVRTKNLLDQMMRKKTALAMETRYQTMIENAFYYCNPPDRQKIVQKVRPPIQEYIRKLVYKDLSKTTTEKVLRQMRKIPWNDKEVADYAIRCLIRIWNVKYSNIHCTANLLAGLHAYHEEIAVHVVDGVLEEIRLGMELNIPKLNQRRVSCVKYLGELYNYRLVDSAVIFHTLYSFLTFGNSEDGVPSLLDPPDHLFRVRLVCILLDTSGQYFDHGSARKKLDCFLVYFQCYYYYKKTNPLWSEKYPFPRDVEFNVADTLEGLRPKRKIYNSLEEAQAALQELQKEYQAQIGISASEPRNIPSKTGFTDKCIPEEPEVEQELCNANKIAFIQRPSSFGSMPKTGSWTSEGMNSPLGQSPTDAPSPLTVGDQETTGSELDTDHEQEEGVERRRRDENEDEIFPMDHEQEDEKVRVISGPKFISSVEDEEFLKEFDHVLSEQYHNRRSESVKVPALDVAVPMHMRGQPAKKSNVVKPNTSPDHTVNFVLVMRKGNKQQYKDLKVPIDSSLAANVYEKQKAELAEQEEVKRLVLDYNQRQEEEVYNEMMSQPRQAPRHRYHGNRRRHWSPAESDSSFITNFNRRRDNWR